MSDSVVQVGQTPAQISLPPVRSVLVLNSSETIGDLANSANIVVDNSADVSLSPQVGCALHPGQSVEFPMVNPSNDHQMQLWAVADGPDAHLTIVIDP
jgi:hypothetical protein